MAPPVSPWPLLSIDGGGMRGLLAARSLQELERRLGRPARELFAAGVGTSTGALLVAGALGPEDPPSAEHLAGATGSWARGSSAPASRSACVATPGRRGACASWSRASSGTAGCPRPRGGSC
jgi:hypothetical protein